MIIHFDVEEGQWDGERPVTIHREADGVELELEHVLWLDTDTGDYVIQRPGPDGLPYLDPELGGIPVIEGSEDCSS